VKGVEKVKGQYILSSGKTITGTLIWYYFICKREVWLMAHEINPDEDHTALEIGRAVHEIYYGRSIREVSMEGIKIDILRKGERAICEIKSSSKFIEAARFQLLYYLYRLQELGNKISGWILIPEEKKRIRVILDKNSKSKLLKVLKEIKGVVDLEIPPPPIKNPYCRRCAYKEFCWV
jgi:CRISPR-associated exonuclease Cas4